MTVRTIRKGTGITRYDALVLNGASMDDIRDTLRYAASIASFEGGISDVEKSARAVLSKLGIDPDQTAKDAAAFRAGLLIDSTCKRVTEEDHNNHTPAYYAETILRYIGLVRGSISENDASEAARWAVDLGVLIREAELKSRWEPSVIRDEKGNQGRRKGGETTGNARRGEKMVRDRQIYRAAQQELAKRKASNAERANLKQVLIWLRRGRYSGLSQSGIHAAYKRGEAHESR